MISEIHFDSGELRPDQREELVAWVAGLGVEVNDVRPQGAIICGERSYELHLSRFVRDEAGKMQLDYAANEVVSEPLVIDLGTTQTWPGFLTAEVCPRCGAPDDECAAR